MKTQSTPIEIFYSFAEEDAHLLERLDHHLSLMQNEKFISTWHKHQIVAGKNMQNEVDDHLNTASLILLLISPDFMASNYLYGVELQRAMERLNKNEALVIPILLRPYDLQGAPFKVLQSLPRNGHPVTLWRNRDEAFTQIAKEIRIALQALSSSDFIAPTPTRIRTRILGDLPQVRTPIGRDELLFSLKRQLTVLGLRSSVVVLHGQSGIGKTTIAAQLAHDNEIHASFSGGILWADLGEKPSLNDILAIWASQLHTDDISNATTVQEKIGCIKANLGHAPFLLILDDLWLKDLDIVNPLLRMVNPGCALVLTTRWRKVADDLGVLVGSKQIPVDELDEKDALTLLTEICQNKPTDPDLLHSLVKAAGGLPLTLEVIGASIIANQHSVPLDGQRLQQIEKRWHLSGATGSHHLSPQEAIDRSVKNLPDRQTQRAFLALGTFAPKPATFSKDAARYVTGANQEILQTLCNCNLLHESSRDRYMFHQSLSKAAQAHLNTNDAAYSRHSIYYRKQVERTTSHKQNERDELKDIDWRTLFLDLSQIRAIRLPEHPASVFSIIINRLSNAIPWLQSLNHHLPGWLKDVLSRILQAGLVLFRIGAHATGQKQIEAILSNYQGWLYAEIGDRGHALTHYTRAYELWDTPGPDHRNDLRRAQVLNNLGKTYYMQARYREAIRAYYHALDIYQAQNNQSLQAHVHTNIGATFDMIGWVHWAIQNFHTALCLYRQVHDERGEALSLHHLGVAYNGLGKREKALTSLEKALSKHTQANNDVGRARTLMELGSVYLDSASVAGQEQASLETAMEYFQEALELQKMFDDRAWQGRTLNRIGQVYAKQGNTRQALDIYLQALLIHQNVNYHAGLSTTLGLISNLFSKAGKDIWARAITNEAKSEHSHHAHLELIFKQLLNVE